MKFTIKKNDLLKALGTVSKATTTKLALPFTSHVLIDAKEDGITFTATNLDLCITTATSGEIEETGISLVPAKLLTEFVNTLPNETVQIATKGETKVVEVKGGKLKANINCIDGSDFPLQQSVDGTIITVEADDLRKAINRVVVATAADDTRPVLTGVFVDVKEGQITLVGADGYRLAVQNISLPQSIEPFSVIVPAVAMREVAQLAAGLDVPVKMVIPKGKPVHFILGSTELFVITIAGTFPNYQQLIPQDHTTDVIVDSKEIAQVLKAVKVFDDNISSAARFYIEPEKPIRITGRSEYGDNEGQVDASITGDPVNIGFHMRYVGEMIGAIGQGNVHLAFNGNRAPGTFKLEGDESYIGVLMPMFLSDL